MSRPYDDSFHVHLISNVAPQVFPENTPAEFSTPLANEIDLKSGAWEVAVQQIMYPTHVSTTTAKDKVLLHKYQYQGIAKLDYPTPAWRTIEDCSAKLLFNPDYIQQEQLINYFITRVNTSKWKELISLHYIKGSKKFTLDLLNDDVLIVLSAALQKVLGFKEQFFFTRSSYWAWSQVDVKTIVIPDDATLGLFILDLTTHRSEKYEMPRAFKPPVVGDTVKAAFEADVVHLFHDSLPHEFKTQLKFQIGLYPNGGVRSNEGCIRFQQVHQYWLQKFGDHENKILFFRFDENATRLLKLDKLYYYQGENYIKTKTAIAPTVENLRKVTVEFFYISPHKKLLRNVALGDGLYGHRVDRPPVAIELDSNEEFTDPEALLPKLNKKTGTHEYNFEWDAHRKRYKMNVTSHVYGIELTKTLASILGFDPEKEIYYKGNYLARDSPVLNRDITSLYVYTNIVDPVYVGNVKAPLLLICPFKRKNDPKNVVHQLEFLNPTYTPVNRNAINQIDIGIYDDAGTIIPFRYGKTKLQLHFRRRQ